MSIESSYAIVGMGCRFPGNADSPTRFWDLLVAGTDAVGPVPADRWDMARFHDEDPDAPGKIYAREGGFLSSSIAEFDAAFFGISPREAAVLDPQQRLLLEVLWEAFEDGGMDARALRGSRTGVYVGGFTLDNMITQLGVSGRDTIFANTATSGTLVMLSNRLSYAFDFRGPSVSVDTACSSSLVAGHLACQALAARECDLAVIGGVNVMMRPEYSMAMCKGGFLSPRSRCHAFDARADGYVRGEGAGVVLVKRLADAQRDGNRIYSLIRATGSNQDGRTGGITVPNPEAQEALVHEVCQRAGIRGGDVHVVEAHGTGTPTGDPVEARSLGRVLSDGRGAAPALIGSVKTNIGHLEAGAGVAGLIKMALILRNREVPPSLHFETPNPDIDFEALKLRVPTQVESLPAEGVLFGVVNSFGYGGTNAHMLLSSSPMATEQGGPTPVPASNDKEPRFLSFSAADPRALVKRLEGGVRALRRNASIDRLAATLAHHRSHLTYRALVSASNDTDLEAAAQALAAGESHPLLVSGREHASAGTAFVYTGMGAQWLGMGASLFDSEPVFRNSVHACDEIWRSLGRESLLPWFGTDDSRSTVTAGKFGEPMDEPASAQPTNLVLQIALTHLWRSRGVEPDAVIGHSAGEIAAAFAAGALSLEDTLSVIHHRSRLQQRYVGSGGMLAVGLGAEEARSFANSISGLFVAAINGPASVTLAGTCSGLEQAEIELSEKNVFHRNVRVAVPYHSPLTDSVEDECRQALSEVRPKTPELAFYSTTLAERVDQALLDADYWWRNLAQPVLFEPTLRLLLADGYSRFVEVGPHPIMKNAIDEVARHQGISASLAHSLTRNTDATEELYRQWGQLYCSGADICWNAVTDRQPPITLESYPWQREKLWYETDPSLQDRIGDPDACAMLQRRVLDDPEPCWRSEISSNKLPWLGDHRVDGLTVLPGAAYIACALEASVLLGRCAQLKDIRFSRALAVEEALEFMLKVEGDQASCYSRPHRSGASWTTHASMTLLDTPRPPSPALLRAPAFNWDGAQQPEHIYARLSRLGLHYGNAFRGILRGKRDADGSFLAEIDLPEDTPDRDHWHLHPAALDACFQGFLLTIDLQHVDDPMVPVSVQEVRVHQPVGGRLTVVGRPTLVTASALVGNLQIYDAHGNLVAEVKGLRCQTLPSAQKDTITRLLHDEVWTERELPSPESTGNWVCLSLGIQPELAIRASEALRSDPGCDVLELTMPYEDRGPREDLTSALRTASDGLVVVVDHPPATVQGIVDTSAALLEVIQILHGRGPRPARICLLSTGSQPAPFAAAAPNPASAAAWGLCRVAHNEHLSPSWEMRLIDTHGHNSLASLRALLTCTSPETEWSLQGGRCAVRRLRPNPSPPRMPDAPQGSASTLENGTPGLLDGLAWLSTPRVEPADNEVEIEVHAVPLNFKDYLKAMGVLPSSYLDTTYTQQALGLEAAGTIVRVGPGVEGFAVGDHVVTPARFGCMRSHVTEHTRYLVHKPQHHSFQEAGCYINVITAHYGLLEIGRLSKGNSVLIHSASGGVGLAAIQVACRVGARVFATAGSDQKRNYLRGLGLEHVYDSRTLNFADDILEKTSGRGVDVVLNSQPGAIMQRSMELLADYGRFVELGKRAIHDNTALMLAGFDRNLSFAAIDIDRMMADNEPLFRRLIDEVHAAFEAHTYQPLPTRTFSSGDAEHAFRTLGSGQHVGKIALDMTRGHRVRMHPQTLFSIDEDATYLITGGLGGFGRVLASWLVENGARHLCLVSRFGARDSDTKAFVDQLSQRGAEVQTPLVDISDREQVQSLIAAIQKGSSPLKGVFHGAMVLDDAQIADLDRARLFNVLAPKALGALWLDAATRNLDLDCFVLLSSIAAVTGNPGQASYVAANAVLDALAHTRRQRGQHAVSINWGVLADVGVVARNDTIRDSLARVGIRALPPLECVKALDHLIRHNFTQVGVVDVEWSRWAQASPESRAPRFSDVVGSALPGEHPLAAELADMDVAAQETWLQRRLTELIARVVDMQVDKVDPAAGLDAMGVDSLMATELIASVNKHLHVELPTMLLLQGPTIDQLSRHILSVVQPGMTNEADIDAMSAEELDALIEAELNAASATDAGTR